MSLPLFAFGSLGDPDVLEVVLGRSAERVGYIAAWLSGYRVARLPDESYPVLIACEGFTAEGVLLQNLGAEDRRRIAFFENREYRFERCIVELADNSRVDALYCSDGQIEPGAREPWSLDAWQHTRKMCSIEDTKCFMDLYGKLTAEEADREWCRWKDE
jgi:hypothetical protein